jgi:hypothetical protein
MNKLILALALLSMAACKKDVVCECTLTVSASSDEPGFKFTEPPPKKTSTTFEHVDSDNPALLNACATYEKSEEIPYKISAQGTLKEYLLVRVTRNQCYIK